MDEGADRVEPPASRPALDAELVGAGRLVLEQLTALRVELDQLSESLRERSATITQVLDRWLDLERASAECEVAAVGEEPPPAALPTPPPGPGLRPPAALSEAAPAPPPAPGQAAPEEHPDAGSPEPAEAAAGGDGDPPEAGGAAIALADARLVALDLALGGSSRAEIEQELAARFDLPDAAGLADEVLASIG